MNYSGGNILGCQHKYIPVWHWELKAINKVVSSVNNAPWCRCNDERSNSFCTEMCSGLPPVQQRGSCGLEKTRIPQDTFYCGGKYGNIKPFIPHWHKDISHVSWTGRSKSTLWPSLTQWRGRKSLTMTSAQQKGHHLLLTTAHGDIHNILTGKSGGK